MKLDRAIFYKFFYAGETENAKGRASVSFYGKDVLDIAGLVHMVIFTLKFL